MKTQILAGDGSIPSLSSVNSRNLRAATGPTSEFSVNEKATLITTSRRQGASRGGNTLILIEYPSLYIWWGPKSYHGALL
jgi:hypothetical protein